MYCMKAEQRKTIGKKTCDNFNEGNIGFSSLFSDVGILPNAAFHITCGDKSV